MINYLFIINETLKKKLVFSSELEKSFTFKKILNQFFICLNFIILFIFFYYLTNFIFV